MSGRKRFLGPDDYESRDCCASARLERLVLLSCRIAASRVRL